MRGVTTLIIKIFCKIRISTHTPHAGRDHAEGIAVKHHAISTHTPHAGRDQARMMTSSHYEISTHTPHAGRDRGVNEAQGCGKNFYSHAPCGA